MSDIENYQVQNFPHATVIEAGELLVLSKTNAKEFHEKMREMIFETGIGLFEYLEVLKFFENVNKYVKGDSQARIPEDSEFVQYVRDELNKYERGKHTTPRGVRYEVAETGTSYDFSGCNDEQLKNLEIQLATKKQEIEERKNFLKNIPPEGLEVITKEGEALTLFPPKKTSKSSFKITLTK